MQGRRRRPRGLPAAHPRCVPARYSNGAEYVTQSTPSRQLCLFLLNRETRDGDGDVGVVREGRVDSHGEQGTRGGPPGVEEAVGLQRGALLRSPGVSSGGPGRWTWSKKADRTIITAVTTDHPCEDLKSHPSH